VTLYVMVISQSGIWACSDNRVTDLFRNGQTRPRTDFSRKHLSIKCTDGEGMIVYSGLAVFDGQQVGDWLRRSIRNVRITLDQMIDLIRSRADQDIAVWAAKASLPHAFLIGCWNARGDPVMVLVSNYEPGSRVVLDRFVVQSWHVVGTAVRIIGTYQAVAPRDFALLERIQRENVKPHSLRDFLKLLAAINYRAALHPTWGRFVSRTSLAAHVAEPDLTRREDTFVVDEADAYNLLEAYRYELPPCGTFGPRTRIPLIDRGYDITDITDAMNEIAMPANMEPETLFRWVENFTKEVLRRWEREA
jgi:hypothetical protein